MPNIFLYLSEKHDYEKKLKETQENCFLQKGVIMNEVLETGTIEVSRLLHHHVLSLWKAFCVEIHYV